MTAHSPMHGGPAMPNVRPIRRSFFARSVHAVAPELIGATLEFKGVGGIIVEVEAIIRPTRPRTRSTAAPQRNAVMLWLARLRLRLPLLRHSLVPQLRVRAGRPSPVPC